jgi:hypothetical protein
MGAQVARSVKCGPAFIVSIRGLSVLVVIMPLAAVQ